MLHSADRHSGGSVGSVSLIAAVIRSRIGPNNRFLQLFLKIGTRHTIGSKPGSLRLGNIREDQSVLSLKLPESLRASSAGQVSVTEIEFDGINIWFIGNEFKEVRRLDLQFLEGANAGLSHSQGSD